MEKIHEIIEKLEEKTPLALTRFNDGEMMGINQVGSVVARGDQVVDQLLSIGLDSAIRHKQKNYYVGIPCKKCYPDFHTKALELVGEDYEHLTSAVVTTNRNYELFSNKLPELLKDRNVIWVGGEDHNLKMLREMVGIDVSMFLKLPSQNCWSKFSDFYNFSDYFRKDDVVLLSCGPTAEVFAYRWFKERPDCTFLDIGSLYDPYTKNRWLTCHTGALAACEECN